MLDEHYPTLAAKRSNNVGLSKVGMLNASLRDSLARAREEIKKKTVIREVRKRTIINNRYS